MKALRFAVASVAATVLGFVSALPVFVLGLAVPGYVVLPLTLGVMALVAGIVASWTTNVMASDRSLLTWVISVAGATAVVLGAAATAAFFVPALSGTFIVAGPPIYALGVSAGVISLSASVAATYLRGPRGRLGWDGAVALAASLAAFLLILSAEMAGLVPLVPQIPSFGDYGTVVRASLIVLVIGLALAVLRSPRISSGHELGRDAAITLASVASIVPSVAGVVSCLCGSVVPCMP